MATAPPGASLSFFAMRLKPLFGSSRTGSDRRESRCLMFVASLYRRKGHFSRAARFGVVLLTGIAGSCATGSPSTVTLDSASVDSTYTCPAGAANAPYSLQATIEVRNGTSSSVTVKSVAAVMTLTAVKGSWLEHVGDKYDAGGVTYSPDAVGAGSSASLKVTIPSACTNGKTPSAGSSYGEYSVDLTVATSSGTHAIASKNRHRIIAA
jgi:hypothetical protein